MGFLDAETDDVSDMEKWRRRSQRYVQLRLLPDRNLNRLYLERRQAAGLGAALQTPIPAQRRVQMIDEIILLEEL